MNDPHDVGRDQDFARWTLTVAKARDGDPIAREWLMEWLDLWAGMALHAVGRSDPELQLDFVERMVRDDFRHLPIRLPAESYLRRALYWFMKNREKHERRLRMRETTMSQLDDEAVAWIESRPAEPDDPLDHLLEEELLEDLDRVVRSIGPENETIVRMRADGYTYAEISKQLGISEGALRKGHSDLMARLRRMLTDPDVRGSAEREREESPKTSARLGVTFLPLELFIFMRPTEASAEHGMKV